MLTYKIIIQNQVVVFFVFYQFYSLSLDQTYSYMFIELLEIISPSQLKCLPPPFNQKEGLPPLEKLMNMYAIPFININVTKRSFFRIWFEPISSQRAWLLSSFSVIRYFSREIDWRGLFALQFWVYPTWKLQWWEKW